MTGSARRWRASALVAVALLAGCGADGSARPQARGFLLPALGAGPKVALTGVPGQPTVVNFFASWCPACVTELPLLAGAASRSSQVRFVGVDVNDGDSTAVSRLLRRFGVGYRVGLDPDGRTALQYRLPGLPDTLFLGADGVVRKRVVGQLSPASLADGLRRLSPTALP